jgi:thioredoxin-related protein
MRVFLLFLGLMAVSFGGEWEKGKEIFQKKCNSCHSGYVAPDKIKSNFFEHNNTLLKLKAPTENMLVYAINDAPKKIGDPSDPEFRQEEIADFLKEYLEKPERENSICDSFVMKFYETKKPIKGLSEAEFMALAKFFMDYKRHRKGANQKIIKTLSKDYSEKEIVKEAKASGKNIIIEATSKYCHYCKTFKREVLESKEVADAIAKDYIFIEVDMEKSKLPFGLAKVYQQITPSFFILNQNGKLLKHYPGSWKKRDFLTILKSHKGEK